MSLEILNSEQMDQKGSKNLNQRSDIFKLLLTIVIPRPRSAFSCGRRGRTYWARCFAFAYSTHEICQHFASDNDLMPTKVVILVICTHIRTALFTAYLPANVFVGVTNFNCTLDISLPLSNAIVPLILSLRT